MQVHAIPFSLRGICVCFGVISTSTLPEAGSVEVVPIATVREPSTADSRIGVTRFSVQEKTDILLRARFREGDAVAHQHFPWKGIVQSLWVENDGTIWASMERTWSETEQRTDSDFHIFSVCEDRLRLIDGEEAGPTIVKFPVPSERPEQDAAVIAD
ncbi:MAG: hypothetical protein PHO20_01175 [Candidatus Peribacteraceae bacterium]|nr:hypothetical protein [Candidatus Peribacteraceae bacterium]MDD5739361.1 hypothetical protein [Candidatus Peribacteraceae bacterium]